MLYLGLVNLHLQMVYILEEIVVLLFLVCL